MSEVEGARREGSKNDQIISETMAPPSAAPGERWCCAADWRDLFSMHHQIASLHPPPATKPIRMGRLPGQSNHLKGKVSAVEQPTTGVSSTLPEPGIGGVPLGSSVCTSFNHGGLSPPRSESAPISLTNRLASWSWGDHDINSGSQPPGEPDHRGNSEK